MQRPTIEFSEDQLSHAFGEMDHVVLREKDGDVFPIGAFCDLDRAMAHARTVSTRELDADCYHVYARWANKVIVTVWPIDLDEIARKKRW